MRKFKVFTASVLTYLMLLSLVPNSFAEMIARASENDYMQIVKNDCYLNSSVQYGDEVIVAYQGGPGGLSKLYISSIKNGKETILKELDGYLEAELHQENDVVKIKIYGVGKADYDEVYYEKLYLDTKKFEKMSEDEWNYQSKDYNYYRVTSDEEVEKNLQKISENTDLKISIKDMNRVSSAYTEYEDENQFIHVKLEKNHKNENLLNGIISISKKENYEYKSYDVVIYNDFVYIKDDISLNANYDEKNELAIIIDQLENGSKVIEIDSQGNKTIRESEIKDLTSSAENIFKINNKLYIHDTNITVWELKNNKYVLENEINAGINSVNNNNDYDDNYYYLNKEDKSLNIIDNLGNISKVMDLGNSVDNLLVNWKKPSIINYKNGNILMEVYNHFTVIQKKVEEAPIVPGEPSDDEVVTPPTGDNNKPSEDTVLDIPVETLKPNEVNEIPVISKDTSKFNLVLKDIETLKNGQGSLKAVLNNVTLNLPFSVLDKTLLGENDTVSVKLDVVANSEITKDLKAVNKVFDFNLVVNKENESVNIHNFKDGVAEITLALSDEELQGLNKDKLKVYYYNEETKKFEAMETKVDGNNVTFKTSHFSKYVIAEEIANNVTSPDNDDEVTIKPDTNKPNTDSTTNNNSNNNNTTNNDQNKTETGKGELPTTGSVVSNNTILVLALGAVLVGGVMFIRKKKVA